MNKLLYTSALCAFSILMSANAAKAIDFPDHYRSLHVTQEYTKQSKDFKAKNLFPFHFPDGLPGTPVFKGAKGQFSTTTQANLDASGKDITYSETLFGIEFTTNRCPEVGEVSYAMDQSFPGSHRGLIGNIVKQTEGDKTQVSNIDYINQYDIVMNMGTKGCGVVYFDGSDFQSKPYTMKVDLQLKYTFQPIVANMGGEYIIDVDNQTQARFNAYNVIPVTSGSGVGVNVLRPGTVFAVDGNISTSGVYAKTAGNWFVRYITAVYKNNSCQVAFKNHSSSRFSWNDLTGVGSAPNPTSALWPTATIISDFTVAGKDRQSIMRQVDPNHNLPVHVEDGDCVVQVALPYGDSTTVAGSNLNMESQTHVTYIPD